MLESESQRLISEPLAAFQADVLRSSSFFSVMADMVKATDTLANTVADGLLQVRSQDHPDRTAWEASLQWPTRRQDWYLSHSDLLVEFVVSRVVDQFLTYITRLLALAYRARPEMLRSSEQVRLDEVLNHETMDDLVDYLAEQQVNRLAYKSLGELADYLQDRLGFAVFMNAEQRTAAVRIVELRNLIVHNSRIVNRIYATRVPEHAGRIGEKVPIGPDTIADAAVLAAVADWMDDQAAEKFGIPRMVVALGQPAAKDGKLGTNARASFT